MAEVRRHVAEEMADDRAVLIVDASTFPKSGADSCGVGRQGCGRLGKYESLVRLQGNCQRGVYLTYASAGGYAPLDRRLYLSRDRADDPARRERCHVPEDVEFRQGWRIAADLDRTQRAGAPPRLGGRR